MLNLGRSRTQPRSNRSMSFGGMDYPDPKRNSSFVGRIIWVAAFIVIFILVLKLSTHFSSPCPFSHHEPGVMYVLVTGGADFIGSHATLSS